MKAIRHTLLGILVITGNLNAEGMSEKWQRRLPTDGRVYLPERRYSDDCRYEDTRRQQREFQERAAYDRRLEQLERSIRDEARRREIERLMERRTVRP